MQTPRYFYLLYALLGAAVLARAFGLDGYSSRLSISDRGDRVVVRWSGPVEAPMHDEIAAAMKSRQSDPRPIVLTIGSLGGSVAEGGRVISLIRQMQRTHSIDTFVDSHCGSMCVPIFLAGTRRTAGPKANFMFHEVRFRDRDEIRQKLRDIDFTTDETRKVEQMRIAMATDDLFRAYFEAPRVNRSWLAAMRKSITGTDVWLTAAELMQQRSGVIDALE